MSKEVVIERLKQKFTFAVKELSNNGMTYTGLVELLENALDEAEEGKKQEQMRRYEGYDDSRKKDLTPRRKSV